MMKKNTAGGRARRLRADSRFVRMTRPLDYPVYCGKAEVIPAGATGVAIRFRASHLSRLDENGQRVPLNVYYWKGRVYHA